MRNIRKLLNPFIYQNVFKSKTKWFLIITLLNITVNITIYLLTEQFFNIDKNENIEALFSLNLISQLLLIGLLYPIVEEFLFRYPILLGRNKIAVIFFLTIPFTVLIVSKFSSLGIFTCIIIYLIFFLNSNKVNKYISKRLVKYKQYTFWVLTVLFSICHIYNFSNDTIEVIVIFTCLTFFSSILFGLIRIHIGFKYAIFSHMIYNCTIIVASNLY